MSIFVFFCSWVLFTTLMSVFIENKWLIFLWVPLGYVVALLTFIGFVFIMLNTYFRKKKFSDRVHVNFCRSTAILLDRFVFRVNVKFENKDKVPADRRIVCYANHRSRVDALIMMEAFNRPSAFTPKDGLYRIRVLHDWFTRLGCMKVTRDNDRETAKELVKAIQRVREGLLMVIYPEGTTKDHETDLMDPARLGSYKMALKAEADILPVSIYGSHLIKKNSPFKKTRIYVKIHDIIPYETFKDMKTSEIDPIVQSKINEGILELQTAHQQR